MKAISSIMILFAIAHSAMGNNEEYKNYCIQMKEKQNVTLSIPENRVKFHTDIPMIIFTFGEMLEELPTLPMFEGKASINLSEHCTVIMEDIYHRQKLNSISSSQHGDYDMPDVPCWILEATLGLFRNFTKQSKYCSDSETFPCSIPGIILIPNHAVNGKLIFKNESGGYGLMCYDHQKGSTIWLQTNYNLCASVPCNVSTGYYGYYK